MTNELDRTGPDQASGHTLLSPFRITKAGLLKYRSLIVSQKIRPTDFGIDVVFKISVPLYCDIFAEMLDHIGVEYEDDDPAWDEPRGIALRAQAVCETEISLTEVAHQKLEEFGISRDGHRVISIKNESYGTFVLIECCFLVQRDPDIERGDGFVCEPKLDLDLEKLSFQITTRQALDAFSPWPDFEFDDKTQASMLEDFGFRAVYYLPWFVHWLLDVGFDIERTRLHDVQKYSVHLNTMWMHHQCRSDDRRSTPPLAVFTHVLYPIALA